MLPEVVRTIADLRGRVAAWRRAGAIVGMVPTMGALHAGHLALVAAARSQTDRVIVTLFVNPRQFAPSEDFGLYPRGEDADRQKLSGLAPEVLFAPGTEEIYAAGDATTIIVGGPAMGLETDHRPHFFSGVATIVAKLLIAGLPDRAFFGEKDYQQLLVVRRMATDLGLPTTIVGCPTVREPDGLALSSRNAYLSPADRTVAPRLHAALQDAARRIRLGEPPAAALPDAAAALQAAGFAVDYFDLRNAETLAPVADLGAEPLRLLAAARLGATRLIDNIAVANPPRPG